MVIKWSVGHERRRMVYLQNIRSAILVKHHVDSQNMEAHVSNLIFRLAEAILMGH